MSLLAKNRLILGAKITLASVSAAALALVVAAGANAQTYTTTSAAQSPAVSTAPNNVAIDDATGVPDFASFPDMTIGSVGGYVYYLQGFLSELGYKAAVLPTGYFGPITKSALTAMQKAFGVIPASGYFGPITRATISTWLGSHGIAVSNGASSNASASGGSSPAAISGSSAPVSTNGTSISSSNLAPLRSTGYWYNGNWYNSIPAPGTADVTGYWVDGVWTPMRNVSTSVAPSANAIASATNGGPSTGMTTTSSNDMVGVSTSHWDPNGTTTNSSSITCSLNSQNVYICR